MFALISENNVVEIADKKFPVAKPLKWVKCDDSVKVGWFYIAKKFRQSLKSDEELFEEAKKKKIAEIKSIRDEKNIEPIIFGKASLINDSGKKTKKNSDFLFYTNRHQKNPSSDPDSIISRVLNIGAMPYFTKDENGNSVTVEITPEIAKSLLSKMTKRNDENFAKGKAIEKKINSAKTIEEIEAISWQENQQ